MKAISQFVVHVFDLIEAEGRGLLSVCRGEARRIHKTAANLALGVAFLVLSVPLLASGIWLMAAGLMWWLETQVARPLAAAITGFVVLGIGLGFLAGFKTLAGRVQP